MKRKSKPAPAANSGLARTLADKVDEYIDSLVQNEDEIVKIITELNNRGLTPTQKKTVNSSFDSYSKTAKGLTDYMKGF